VSDDQKPYNMLELKRTPMISKASENSANQQLERSSLDQSKSTQMIQGGLK
jgi:hypothetical protein